MAKRRKKPQQDPGGPGEWIVTFSDCMTLLLCFFVLMLTFSSFDKVTLKQLSGAFSYASLESVFPRKMSVTDSMVEPVPRQVHATHKGSEMPTDLPAQTPPDPRRMEELLNADAHRDRKVFYIPVEKMFWGNGLVMRDEGKGYLDMIASFLDVMPCFVIINESRPPGSGTERESLGRAWQMVKYCKDRHGLPARYFSIAADGGAVSRERFDGQPVVEFALVAPRVYR